ncbi:DUF1651 domain-containing protein [Synechococcus sp. CS-1330]|nr:DUF1651 domain-containing protein [Synechococcus sp. CS-1330]
MDLQEWIPRAGWSAYPMYFVDSGRPLPGAPPLLKTRSHMRRNDAREMWLRLKAQAGQALHPPRPNLQQRRRPLPAAPRNTISLVLRCMPATRPHTACSLRPISRP